MTDLPEYRIHVVIGASTYGVTVALGETLITIKSPRAPGSPQLSDDQLRAAALRTARRALEVGLEEVTTATAASGARRSGGAPPDLQDAPCAGLQPS